VYTLGFMTHLARLEFPNLFRIAIGLILLANLRATFLASEWRPAAEGEDRPTRFNETLADKFVDQMPARLWPVLQIPFLILGIAMLLLTLLMLGAAVAARFGLLPHK
jgi:hypothetical protein